MIRDLENHLFYTSADDIKAICKPLFDHMEINFFQYVRHYYSGGRLVLSSNKEWVKDYFKFEHYHHEYVNFGKEFKEHQVGYNIWSGCAQNHPSCQLWLHSQKAHGIDHLLALHSNHDTYCEMFHFGGKEYETHLPSVFFSNLSLFERFSLYFLEKARPIIEKANTQLFLPPKVTQYKNTNRWVLGIEDEHKENFIKRIQINKFYLRGHLEDQYLTYRQMECLKGIVEGKSYNEIAKDLHISHRTVDYHLAEVRQIFKVKTKRQLIEALHENDVMPYLAHI